MTTATDIRDDLIAQDVRYRRVDAAIRREVNARLAQLGRDTTALMLRIDVAGTKQPKARLRRLRKLNRELGILTRTAYSEIGGITKVALRRLAQAETKSTIKIVGANLP